MFTPHYQFKSVITVVVAACMAMFMTCLITGGYKNTSLLAIPNDTLIHFGARVNLLILERNQVFRLLSPLLLHYDLTHLFATTAVFIALGQIIERDIGHSNFVVLCLLTGTGGILLACCCDSSFIPSLSCGLNPLVYGFCGLNTACFILNYRVNPNKCTTCMVVLFGFVLALLCDQPYPDFAADAGGFAVGFCYCLCCVSSGWVKYAGVAALLLWFVLLLTLFYT
jgi:membrane associated rhomboid family serine protease